MENLSLEQKTLIRDIAAMMKTQNNRHTSFPIFCVYEKKEVVHFDSSCNYDRTDRRFHPDNGDADELLCEDCLKLWNEGDGTLADLPEECGDCVQVYIEDIEMPVEGQYYLTEAAALAEIRNHSYRYNKPYVYAESAYNNPELQKIIKIIFALAGIEVPMPYL